jgi:hypothetical protein
LHLELLDDELRRLIGEAGYRPAGWADAEIRHLLLLAQCAGAAKTQSDLHSLRVLRFRIHPDDAPGTSSVQLSAGRRVTIIFKADSIPMTAVLDVLSSGTEELQ